jgi:hypothetical protein
VFFWENIPTPAMKISENCSLRKPRGMHRSLCVRLLSREKRSHMVTKGKININAGFFSNNAGVIGLSERACAAQPEPLVAGNTKRVLWPPSLPQMRVDCV